MGIRGYCEFCPMDGVGCRMCKVFEEHRWEDDGGRAVYVDHDCETLPAETLRECAALTSGDREPVRQTWHERVALVLGMGVWLLWVAGVVYWFGFRR